MRSFLNRTATKAILLRTNPAHCLEKSIDIAERIELKVLPFFTGNLALEEMAWGLMR